MHNDYLKLSNGRSVRLEWNMNALALWKEKTGKDLSDLSNSQADPATMLTIAWCAAFEGEEADGRILDLSERELGRLMDMECVIKFAHILTSQGTSEDQKKSEMKTRRPKIFFRREKL
jgi:hypothetical protein